MMRLFVIGIFSGFLLVHPHVSAFASDRTADTDWYEKSQLEEYEEYSFNFAVGSVDYQNDTVVEYSGGQSKQLACRRLTLMDAESVDRLYIFPDEGAWNSCPTAVKPSDRKIAVCTTGKVPGKSYKIGQLYVLPSEFAALVAASYNTDPANASSLRAVCSHKTELVDGKPKDGADVKVHAGVRMHYKK